VPCVSHDLFDTVNHLNSSFFPIGLGEVLLQISYRFQFWPVLVAAEQLYQGAPADRRLGNTQCTRVARVPYSHHSLLNTFRRVLMIAKLAEKYPGENTVRLSIQHYFKT